jgi:SAM-dependent methyltransferase
VTADTLGWTRWQELWDRQQAFYLPDREERLGALVRLTEAAAGPRPRVLDLACGCGSITRRVLARMPGAQVVGVDVDPVLLRIAAGVFVGDPRVHLVAADLRNPDWTDAVPGRFDAVLTATALHWLPEAGLVALLGSVRNVLTAGGLFANADHMPPTDAPGLLGLAKALAPPAPEGALDWDGWWKQAAADPVLGPLVAERDQIFNGASHPAEFTPPVSWHLERLRDSGFAEAAEVWRRAGDAIVAARVAG